MTGPDQLTELIDLRHCQHDNGYMDGRSQIKVHTDERTQGHSAQSSQAVTHSSTNWARHYFASVTDWQSHQASMDLWFSITELEVDETMLGLG